MALNDRKILFVASIYRHLTAFHMPFMLLLMKKGYEVHAAARDDGRRGELEKIGVITHDIPFARSPYSPANFAAYRKLKRLLTENAYNLIHVHTPTAAFLARLAARNIKTGPVIYTAHGFHFYQGAPRHYWLVYYNMERLAFRWTDVLLVMNQEDYDSARRMGFKDGKNLFLVPGVGIDVEEVRKRGRNAGRVYETLGIAASEPVFLCVAEFTPNKNQQFLLTAWSMYKRRGNPGTLLLVGDGETWNALQKMVNRDKIPDVRFLGYRSDVPELLAGCTVFLLVSKREGLPRSVMEAMAAGKPVIVSNVRGNRDLVQHGVNGLLVELNDVSQLCESMEYAVKHPDEMREMGLKGQEIIMEYDVNKVLGIMERIYSRFLDNH